MEHVLALSRTGTYLVYCQDGTVSTQMVNWMISNGFTKVYNLIGGFNAWVAAGYPRESYPYYPYP